jgi:hypothetical protein
MLPGVAKADLTAHLEVVKRQHEHDLRHGARWVELPWALPQVSERRPRMGVAVGVPGHADLRRPRHGPAPAASSP